ncbi:MAG: hypothetical protein IKG61_04530, partial [Selenomonadaceae bacterium]|nr:hypothetical protein [Selenomonadaceae bacterium]
HFIAQCVRNYHVNFVGGICHIAPIKIQLMMNAANTSTLPQIVRAGCRPIFAQLAEVPILIKPLDFLRNVIE